jgi:uncharacterized metal-binding protein YceD (DUF177 family)
MKLRLPSLREGRNPVEDRLDPGEIGLETDVFHQPVQIFGTADMDDAKVDVRLEISIEGHFICDRCAVEFDRSFDVSARVIVLRRDAHDSDEEEADGLLFIGVQGTEADLSGDIVDAILLAVPLKKLCKPDCKGLCPVCYVDWNEETCEHYDQYPHNEENDNISPSGEDGEDND